MESQENLQVDIEAGRSERVSAGNIQVRIRCNQGPHDVEKVGVIT